MSEKKIVTISVAIVLGIICIALIGGVAVAAMEWHNSNALYNDYVSGHSHTDSEYNNMSTQYQNELSTYNNYVSSHSHTDTEYQNEVTTYNNYVANHSYTNDQFNNAIATYESNHHYTDAQYNTLNTNYQNAQSQISNLTSQVNNLTNIVNLAIPTTWETNLAVNEGADTYWSMHFTGVNYAGYVMVTVLSSTAGNTYVEAIYSHNGISFDRKVDLTSSGGTGTAVFPVLPTSDIEIRVGNSNLFTAASQTISIYYTY